MPKIHTHLSLGILLSEHIKLNGLHAFLLGNAYPDVWNESVDEAIKLHYKKNADSPCDLSLLLNDYDLNDEFYLGYYFHLWVDNEISNIDISDISKYDCMICDMDVISPAIPSLSATNNKEDQALNNIYKLLNEPMPLYIVHNDKKVKYLAILEALIQKFIIHLHKIGVKYESYTYTKTRTILQ